MVPQRFVSARDLICIKNVGCPGPITQIALMRPLLTTTANLLRVLGIVPLDRRYYLSFTENHWFCAKHSLHLEKQNFLIWWSFRRVRDIDRHNVMFKLAIGKQNTPSRCIHPKAGTDCVDNVNASLLVSYLGFLAMAGVIIDSQRNTRFQLGTRDAVSLQRTP